MADQTGWKPSRERPIVPTETLDESISSPEVPKDPESLRESESSEPQESASEESDAPSLAGRRPATPTVTPTPNPRPPKDRLTQEIESVLEEDLTDLYLKLSPEKQKQFQAKGEETMLAIRELILKAKINAKKIFRLIHDWLKLLSGVNRFFLVQEAKIKTDKILALTEENKHQ